MFSHPNYLPRLRAGRIRIRLFSVLVLTLAIQVAHRPTAIASPLELAPKQEKPALNPQEVASLELGRRVVRELAGEQEHSYQITLAQGEYANAVVEQHGIDVVVQLLGDDGKSIVEFDSEARKEGEERIELVAGAAGNYRLLLKAKYPKLPAGSYEIRLVEVRAARENDRLLDEARRLITSSWQLMYSSKYQEPLIASKRALELEERVLGMEHPTLAYSLFTLGFINRFLADYEKAEAFYLRGLRIAESGLGLEHPLVGLILNSLAYNYYEGGNYTRAESVYKRALSVREKAFGPDHPQVANSLTDLGYLYIDMGDYARPEPLLQRALHIYENTLGEDHVNVAHVLMYLGIYYDWKGDYASAEPLLQRTLVFWEKKFGPNHGWVGIGLENLAELYRDMGDYAGAEPLYQRAISIHERNNGPNHPTVINARAELALLYCYWGKYAKAEALYLNLLPTMEKLLGPNHPMVGFHLSTLAKVYVALNEYAKAEPLYHRAIPIMEAYCGTNCPDLAEAFLGLAKLSAAQHKSEQAVGFQQRANAIIEHNLDINLASGSERQKLAYLVTLPEQMSQAISFHLHAAADNPDARDLAATAILQRKGRVQDALSNSLYSLRSRSNAEDQAVLQNLNRTTSRLARLVLDNPQNTSSADQKKEINNLEAEREKIEAEISRRSAEFRSQHQSITLDSVRRTIPDRTALVEFAVYRPFDPKASDNQKAYGEPCYVAYVIHQRGDVEWKDLGTVKDIDVKLDAFRGALRDPQHQDVKLLARGVDEAVMRPLRPLIGDAVQLLVSPDGELNLVPFAALVDESGRYLIERYSFTYLTSGRDLLRMQVARESKTNPVVIANPLFGEPDTPLLAKTSAPEKSVARVGQRRSMTTGNDLSEVYFAPLAGTAREAGAIHALFSEASLLTGPQATESALKQVAAPRILHIATHGFFLSEPPRVTDGGSSPVAARGNGLVPPAANRPSTSSATRGIRANANIQNPLLRSGLALAGANLRQNPSDDDGILTALEASGLNLWGTKLVVLSACDTGVGEVRNGEGVYGLRRAFVLAGAESLVMTLWPVSDYTTRELMTGYYRNLKQGLGRGEALRQVQLDMLKRNPKLHPFYWANFIQSGEWANLEGKR